MGYGSKEVKGGAPGILRHMKGDYNNMVIKHDEQKLGRGGHLGGNSPARQGNPSASDVAPGEKTHFLNQFDKNGNMVVKDAKTRRKEKNTGIYT